MKKIVAVSAAMVLGFVMVSSAGSACCGASKAPAKVKADTAKVAVVADKAVKNLEPVIVCGKCGEVKGSKKCCKKAKECKKCKLHKGSVGCCKMTADGKNMVQCPKSGKLMACPMKDGQCNVGSLKAACKAGQVKGCKIACKAGDTKGCNVSATACTLPSK